MKYYLVAIYTFLSLGILGQGIKMTTGELNAFKQKIEKETQALTSIQKDFIQYKHLAFLSNDIESKGKMYLLVDKTLKWTYNMHNQYSIILKNNKILIDEYGKKSNVS